MGTPRVWKAWLAQEAGVVAPERGRAEVDSPGSHRGHWEGPCKDPVLSSSLKSTQRAVLKKEIKHKRPAVDLGVKVYLVLVL